MKKTRIIGMENKNLPLIIGWLVIAGATLLIAAVLFCNSALIKTLIICGCLLIIIAFVLPFIFEGEE